MKNTTAICSITNERITTGYFLTEEKRYIKYEKDLVAWLRERDVDIEGDLGDETLIRESHSIGEFEQVEFEEDLKDFSKRFHNLKIDLNTEFRNKLSSLKEGKSLMLIGEKNIVPTADVKSVIEGLQDEYEDLYNELLFGTFYDNNGEPIEYKIVGFSIENKETYVHIHNWDNFEEYMHIKKEDFNITLGVFIDIVDMM